MSDDIKMSSYTQGLMFSVCVPTRNRADTLEYCLKTLLHQDFDEFEIVVSDNSDAAESELTQSVIEKLNSDKIKYYRPERILSMTENFEFTLDKARGKYILFLGDDDGLVTNSLKYVYNKIKEKSPDIIKSPNIVYYWPSSFVVDQTMLTFPVRRPDFCLSSREVLAQVSSFDLNYYALPMIYYSFVNREIIEHIIDKSGSFFQDSISPDIYSGILLAHYTESYLLTEKPFTISGLSDKSNGSNSMKKPDSEISKEFKKQQKLVEKFKKFEIPTTHKSGFDNTVLFEILLFKENHKVKPDLYPIDYHKFVFNKTYLSDVINNISELPNTHEFIGYQRFESILKDLKQKIISKQVFYPQTSSSRNLLVNKIHIDPNLFHAENVYDISCLCEKICQNYGHLQMLTLKNIDGYLKKRRKNKIKTELITMLKKIRYFSGELLRMI